MSFYLGCAVWAYKGWVGNFYPAKSRSSDFLNLYSQRFNAVEGNTTFYVVPELETMQRWVADTANDFKFCLKLPKTLTHSGQLTPCIPGALEFVDQVKALGDRLGPIFAQLPPNYDPSNYTDLQHFLYAWPRHKVPLALEVRHHAWFKEPYASRLDNLLEELQIGRTLLDTRPIYSAPSDPRLTPHLFTQERRKPKLPLALSVTTNFSLVRFISHPNPEFNQVFWQEWAIRIKDWLDDGIKVYFFVHCPIEDHSPHNAYEFRDLLEQNGILVPPVNLPIIVEPTPTETQLNLFS